MKDRELSNILIAEFMGRRGQLRTDLFWISQPYAHWITSDMMQYHTSWDWLMPVVIKCFEVEAVVEPKFIHVLNDALVEVNITSLYEAVINLIKNYGERV